MSKFINVNNHKFRWNNLANKYELDMFKSGFEIICVDNITRVEQIDRTTYAYDDKLYAVHFVDGGYVTISENDYEDLLLPAMNVKGRWDYIIAKRMLNSVYGMCANFNYNDTDSVTPRPKLQKNVDRGAIEDKWKWVARDSGGALYLYENKPHKDIHKHMWSDGNGDSVNVTKLSKTLFGDLVAGYIKWEDEEPTKIED